MITEYPHISAKHFDIDCCGFFLKDFFFLRIRILYLSLKLKKNLESSDNVCYQIKVLQFLSDLSAVQILRKKTKNFIHKK